MALLVFPPFNLESFVWLAVPRFFSSTPDSWLVVRGLLGVIPKPPAPVPVIIFGGFCNWLELCGVLGFWDEKYVYISCLFIDYFDSYR